MKKNKTAAAPHCATCANAVPDRICMSGDGLGHKGCPTLTHRDLLEQANSEYGNSQTGFFARQASIQEASCYANRDQRPYIMQPTKTRIVEICEFAKRMDYKRLGLVFCIGLQSEAIIVDTILKKNDFDVVSICCKAGRTSKSLIGVEDKDKIFRGTDESMCNPVFQAKVVNEQKTDFNILLGLCVGHDSLFFKHADAYTTVLAVKDRVTGNNPLAAIYLHGSYYRKLVSMPVELDEDVTTG